MTDEQLGRVYRCIDCGNEIPLNGSASFSSSCNACGGHAVLTQSSSNRLLVLDVQKLLAEMVSREVPYRDCSEEQLKTAIFVLAEDDIERARRDPRFKRNGMIDSAIQNAQAQGRYLTVPSDADAMSFYPELRRFLTSHGLSGMPEHLDGHAERRVEERGLMAGFSFMTQSNLVQTTTIGPY